MRVFVVTHAREHIQHHQYPGKLVEIGFGFKALSQFSSQRFEFIFVHKLPVSVVGMNISKTGRYTI
ncbi:hypothetical protein DAF14_22230 [Salmonella enterica subsp. enterica serovar Rissen]|nr:hypothetical protein [Salmonella enterica subsp. enterica serovar Rissen]EEF1638826.1 hypothetical protein [Salmonella enterica subsp. enterica serovar Rissen]